MISRTWKVTLFCVCSFITLSFPKRLPSSIKKCKLDSEDLNQCITEQSQEFLAQFSNGNSKINFPVLRPFIVSEIVFKPTPDLSILLHNTKTTGFDSITFLSTKFNLTENRLTYKMYIPKITFEGTYEAHGKLLFFPIEGTGPLVADFINGTYIYDISFKLNKKNSDEYLIYKNSTAQFEFQDLRPTFENLFNGNKLLGDITNQLLREHWKIVVEDYRQTIADVFNNIFTGISSQLFNVVSINELFET